MSIPLDRFSDRPAENTDRELWRDGDDWCSDRIFVTQTGGIGIDCGGTVFVMPLRRWHEIATTYMRPRSHKR